MKKYINKILFLLTFTALIVGCEKDDIVVINEDFTTTVSLSSDNIVLEESNEGMEALKVTWTQPDFGYSAAAQYNILFDLSTGDFSNPESVSAGSSLEKSFNTEDLNKVLLNLGAEPGTAAQLQVKVDIIMSKQYSRASDTSELTATAYSGVLDLTTPWGVVGSAAPNGWDGPDAPFYKSEENGVYVAYVTMTEGAWKIRKDNKWDENYGSDNADNTLQPGGSDIPVTAGVYKIVFDENNLTYTIEEYTWGLVGSATPNGWGDGPDTALEYDSCSDTWKAVINMVDGEWKVRQNNAWSVNYGDKELDGYLDTESDNNIPVTSGTYLVTVDFKDLSYEIVETDVWGIVGSGYNDWGATPDYPFTPDYCNEGVHYAYGVTLVDGEIKFRTNNEWVNDYGDKELDGILDKESDNNIPSVAGVYDIMLDFSNPSVPTYTMTKK